MSEVSSSEWNTHYFPLSLFLLLSLYKVGDEVCYTFVHILSLQIFFIVIGNDTDKDNYKKLCKWRFFRTPSRITCSFMDSPIQTGIGPSIGCRCDSGPRYKANNIINLSYILQGQLYNIIYIYLFFIFRSLPLVLMFD